MNLEFLTLSLLVVASPGTGAAVTIATGLARGTRTALVAAFGCTLGIVPHMLAAVTGLAALLHASALAFEAVKVAGVAYLLYIAWMTWHEKGVLEVKADSAERTDCQVIRHAVLVNLLNPKLSVFFLAFLPQFVVARQGAVPLQLGLLGLIFTAQAALLFGLLGWFSGSVGAWLNRRPAVGPWLDRLAGTVFVGLGLRMIVAR